jgi:hypothetical protein
MWGVASTLAETHAADPGRFPRSKAWAAGVNLCDRNQDGLFGRSRHDPKYQ